jgi:glycosyltransferase involved in cell wall biosynthesis
MRLDSTSISVTSAMPKDTPSTSRKLKILHVGKYYPPHPGGIETHLATLCDSLRKWCECEVLVASEGRRSSDAVVDGVRVRRLATWTKLAGAPACPAMIPEIARSDADVVHLQWPNPMAFAAYLASGRRGPLVVSWQSDVIKQRILNQAFTPLTRAILSRTTAILVSSPGYARSSPILRDFVPKLRVVPIGIAVECFQKLEIAAVQRLRETYGPRIILAVGRLVYYKGFEFLIRAMKSVDGTLLIAGEGPLRRRLEREAQTTGVANRVFFLGQVENIVPLYQACDVFVLPSVARSEAFGIVQLEAMASGKPVINTKLDSGVPYVSLDGITGLTVPPADAEALSDAINRLLTDPELRCKYGDAGVRRVEREFSLERMGIRIKSVYDKALSIRHQ